MQSLSHLFIDLSSNPTNIMLKIPLSKKVPRYCSEAHDDHVDNSPHYQPTIKTTQTTYLGIEYLGPVRLIFHM